MTKEEMMNCSDNIRHKYDILPKEFNKMFSFKTEKELVDYLDSFKGDIRASMYKCYNEVVECIDEGKAPSRYLTKPWCENAYGLTEEDVDKLYSIFEKNKNTDEYPDLIKEAFPKEKQNGALRLLYDLYAQILKGEPGYNYDIVKQFGLTCFELNEFITLATKTPEEEMKEIFGDKLPLLAYAALKSDEAEEARPEVSFEVTDKGVHLPNGAVFEEVANYLWDITSTWGQLLNAVDNSFGMDIIEKVKTETSDLQKKMMAQNVSNNKFDLLPICDDYCKLWLGFKDYADVLDKIYGYNGYYKDFVNGKTNFLKGDVTLTKGNTITKEELLSMLSFFTKIYDVIGDNFYHIGIIEDNEAWKSLLRKDMPLQEKLSVAENYLDEDYRNQSFKQVAEQFIKISDAYNKVIKLIGAVYGVEGGTEEIGNWVEWLKQNNIEGLDIKED